MEKLAKSREKEHFRKKNLHKIYYSIKWVERQSGLEFGGCVMENQFNSQKDGRRELGSQGPLLVEKAQDDVITSYFYPLVLIIKNYNINYRMCYLKIRCLYYEFFSIVLPSVPVLSFSLLKQLASL